LDSVRPLTAFSSGIEKAGNDIYQELNARWLSNQDAPLLKEHAFYSPFENHNRNFIIESALS
jgi:hypothetical protein